MSNNPKPMITRENEVTNRMDDDSCIYAFNYLMTLHQGANLKSFYALPEDVSVENIMAPLDDNIIGVITEAGGCLLTGTQFGWQGTACDIQPEKGYI